MNEPRVTAKLRKKYLPRRLLYVVIIVVLIGGACWWRSPSSLRVVGQYECKRGGESSCAGGFLYTDLQGHLIFRDWSGRERWRTGNVQINPSRQVGYEYRLSDDGQSFWIVGKSASSIDVRCFHAGVNRGDIVIQRARQQALKDQRDMIYSVANGDLFVYLTLDRQLFVIRDGRIIARTPLDLMPGGIADDGSVAMLNGAKAITSARIAIKDGQIALHRQFTFPVSMMDKNSIFTGTAIVSGDGAFYDNKGKHPGMPGWKIDVIISDNGQQYLLDYGVMSQFGGASIARFGVLSMPSGVCWTFSPPDESFGEAVSDGGKHVMLKVVPTRSVIMEGVWDAVYNRFPLLLGQEFEDRFSQIAIFEYPGRLRAKMSCHQFDHLAGNNSQSMSVALSPDGHAVMVTCVFYGVVDRRRVYLLRW